MAEQQQTSKPCQRKRVYVDRFVQGGVIWRLALLWLATSILAIGVSLLLRFFADPLNGFANYLLQAKEVARPLVIAYGVTLPIAGYYLMQFTHRFVGPIIRLRRGMRELAAGENAQPIQFRREDHWQGLATEFNEVASALQQARARIVELEAQLGATASPAVSVQVLSEETVGSV